MTELQWNPGTGASPAPSKEKIKHRKRIKANRSKNRRRRTDRPEILLVYRNSRGELTRKVYRLGEVEQAIAELRGVERSANEPATAESAQLSPAVEQAEVNARALLEKLNSHPHTRLLSAGSMARYADKGRNWPSQRASRGELIRVDHAGKAYYPAFQIDPDSAEVRSWVPKMIEILDELDLDGRDFTIWAAIKSDRFGGDAPVEHMGDEDFLSKAAGAFTPA